MLRKLLNGLTEGKEYTAASIAAELGKKIFVGQKKRSTKFHQTGKMPRPTKYNLPRLSAKYGIPERDLDTAIGMAIMGTLNGTEQGVIDTILPYIQKGMESD